MNLQNKENESNIPTGQQDAMLNSVKSTLKSLVTKLDVNDGAVLCECINTISKFIRKSGQVKSIINKEPPNRCNKEIEHDIRSMNDSSMISIATDTTECAEYIERLFIVEGVKMKERKRKRVSSKNGKKFHGQPLIKVGVNVDYEPRLIKHDLKDTDVKLEDPRIQSRRERAIASYISAGRKMQSSNEGNIEKSKHSNIDKNKDDNNARKRGRTFDKPVKIETSVKTERHVNIEKPVKMEEYVNTSKSVNARHVDKEKPITTTKVDSSVLSNLTELGNLISCALKQKETNLKRNREESLKEAVLNRGGESVVREDEVKYTQKSREGQCTEGSVLPLYADFYVKEQFPVIDEVVPFYGSSCTEKYKNTQNIQHIQKSQHFQRSRHIHEKNNLHYTKESDKLLNTQINNNHTYTRISDDDLYIESSTDSRHNDDENVCDSQYIADILLEDSYNRNTMDKTNKKTSHNTHKLKRQLDNYDIVNMNVEDNLVKNTVIGSNPISKTLSQQLTEDLNKMTRKSYTKSSTMVDLTGKIGRTKKRLYSDTTASKLDYSNRNSAAKRPSIEPYPVSSLINFETDKYNSDGKFCNQMNMDLRETLEMKGRKTYSSATRPIRGRPSKKRIYSPIRRRRTTPLRFMTPPRQRTPSRPPTPSGTPPRRVEIYKCTPSPPRQSRRSRNSSRTNSRANSPYRYSSSSIRPRSPSQSPPKYSSENSLYYVPSRLATSSTRYSSYYDEQNHYNNCY